MDLQPIFEVVTTGALSLLSVMITVGVTWAGAALKRLLDSRAHLAAFTCATTKVENLVIGAVHEVEQTLVRKFKEEQSWNYKTAREARDTAVAIVKRHLGGEGAKEVQKCLSMGVGELEGFIRTRIEALVSRSGGGEGPVVPLGK